MRSKLIAADTSSLKQLGIGLITVLLALITPAAIAQQAALNSSLQPADNGVHFILSNNSTETLSVLRWDTPFEAELSQDVFTIVTGNSSLPSHASYSGRLVKRGKPQPHDFISIKPGTSISTQIPLTDYYRIADGGTYRVSFSGTIELQLPSYKGALTTDSTKSISLHSDTIAVNLTPAPVKAYARVGGYNSCSAVQQTQLVQDLNASEQITQEARLALTNLPENERAGSPRYLQWFGTYSASRYSKVLDAYKKAERVMADGSVEFNCDCNENFFAYVFPIDPFKVYLCNLYWNAAQTGSDSRAGTILHELSHFPEVSGTNDNAYGASDATSLALSSPNSAVNNADSIEYFAENTPFLEISAGVTTPAPPTQYSSLQPGNSVPGSVALNETDFFQVSGADAVVLTTTTGDADLSVYADSTREQLLCESRLTESIDRCVLSTSSTVYIEVLGYAASQYNLLAQTAETSVVEPPVVIEGIPPGPVVTPEANPIASVCEDTGIIGDGWGWNGTNSCELPTHSDSTGTSTPIDIAGTCTDTDGDGWGWNGTDSCLVATAGNTDSNTDAPAGTCIDSDGDGWGWNGIDSCAVTEGSGQIVVADCIDIDGDGWGWNGLDSCYVGKQKQ